MLQITTYDATNTHLTPEKYIKHSLIFSLGGKIIIGLCDLQKVTGWCLASNSSWQMGQISSSLMSRCGTTGSASFCVSADDEGWARADWAVCWALPPCNNWLISRSTRPSCHETMSHNLANQYHIMGELIEQIIKHNMIWSQLKTMTRNQYCEGLNTPYN